MFYFVLIIITLFVSFGHGSARVPCRTLVVSKSGPAQFSTIQAAINSIPSDNKNWVCINVGAGIYREKVVIPPEKPFIYLRGAGKRKSVVVWDDHQSIVDATFSSLASNIFVKSMSFVNSYNSRNSNNPRKPAVAAMIQGDKSFFYKCGFSGLQDTLWDAVGRHYFKSCTIEGAVDFIFGNGLSIYEGCSIHFLGDQLEPGVAGFITAQGRESRSEGNGFVFKNCKVLGKGTAFLGRPWRAYAMVLFYNTSFADIIHPKGWDAWNFAGNEGQLTFAEYGNRGPGSDTSRRVSWEKKLSGIVVNQLTSLSSINKEGWLQNQPSFFHAY